MLADYDDLTWLISEIYVVWFGTLSLLCHHDKIRIQIGEEHHKMPS